LFAAGVILSLGLFTEIFPLFDTLISLALVVLIFVYGTILMKAQKKYLVGLKDGNNKK
jgi:divalent metal cation (Fe/Co/Zn/Cd) transporter